jgi:hypothetical protein
MMSPVEGTTAGYWCHRSAVAPSPRVVSGAGVPPSADIWKRFWNALKTMRLSSRHTPKAKRPFCISLARLTGGEPSSATFFSSPPTVKNASERPSGEKNGCPAPSVPGMGSPDSRSRALRYSIRRPGPLLAA